MSWLLSSVNWPLLETQAWLLCHICWGSCTWLSVGVFWRLLWPPVSLQDEDEQSWGCPEPTRVQCRLPDLAVPHTLFGMGFPSHLACHSPSEELALCCQSNSRKFPAAGKRFPAQDVPELPGTVLPNESKVTTHVCHCLLGGWSSSGKVRKSSAVFLRFFFSLSLWNPFWHLLFITQYNYPFRKRRRFSLSISKLTDTFPSAYSNCEGFAFRWFGHTAESNSSTVSCSMSACTLVTTEIRFLSEGWGLVFIKEIV